MAENKNEATSQKQEPSESVSLDELYGQFTQETRPSQSTQQRQSEEQPRTSYNIPDPVSDAEGFKGYMGNIQNELAAARSEARKASDELQAERQKVAVQTEEREFRNVAEEIAKKAEVDADLVEAGLLYKFVKDGNFQQMWQNRNSNPNAFTKVKSVLGQEMRDRFSTKVDPQIAENQRAAEEATKNAVDKRQEEKSADDKAMSMTGAEFDRWVRNQING